MASIISELLDKGLIMPDNGKGTLSIVKGLAERRKGEKKIFMFLDGLGMNAIERYKGVCDSSELLKRSELTRTTTQFPSTTPNILANFNCGLPTAEHGIVGGTLPASESGPIIGSLRIALPTILGFAGKERIGGIDVGSVYPRPMLIDSLKERYAFATVTHDYLVGTDLNLFFFGSGTAVPYASFGDGMAKVADAVKGGSKDFIYFYYDGLDKEEHHHAIGSPEFSSELKKVMDGIGRLLPVIEEHGYELVITTDHGHMSRKDSVDLNASGIMDHLDTQPWGEPRCVFVKVKDGSEKRFEDFFASRLAGRALLVESEELIRAGAFGGPVSGKLRYRFGTHVMLPLDGVMLDYVYPDGDPGKAKHLSHHGGMSPDEMSVPVIRYNGQA
ncbi:MAG: alkaline phosphatase family protein [Candidatus Micrarchaeota archaeon]|nr:alkaline phosphatase family protein [Candidatus Micrarchaeota archaeon]